jgi:hypothetical protein
MEEGTKKPVVRLLEWTLAICTLLGGLAATVTFLPRITITPSDPVDPDNLFSVSFTVTNASFIPITLNDADVRVVLGQILAEPLPFNPPKKFDVGPGGITRPEWSGHSLRMDERFTVTLQGMFGMAKEPPYVPAKLSGADLAIAVTYKPWLFPWQRETVFRFTTHRQSNGGLYWYSNPLE